MIVRIVKMHFKAEEVETFKSVFANAKEKIRAFPGVNHLELWQDKNQAEIFFTYSLWDSEEDLENYRHSELFKTTWAKTKPLFAKAAEAWSNQCLERLA